MGVARTRTNGSNVKAPEFRENLGLGTAAVLDVADIDALIASAIGTIDLSGYALLVDLTDGLAGKSNVGHTHPQSDVANLPADLAAKIDGSTGATTNRLVKSSGTGGKTIQATGIAVDGSDNLTAPGTLHQFGPTNTTSDIRIGSAGIRGALFASLWQDYGFRRATDQLTIGGTWGAGFPTNWDPVHLFNTTGLNLTNSVGVRLHTGTLAGNLHFLQGHLRATGTKTITLDDGQSGAVTFVVNGIVRVGQYTDATLPTAGTAGRIAYSSDSGLVHDNGTNWRKATYSNV